jgi:hypothetical protein
MDNNHCRECGQEIQVQIMKNSGFCCAQHQDKHELKQEAGKAFKKVAKKRAAKKAVRTVVE